LNVSSYWFVKKTRGYWKLKKKALYAFCGEQALEEAADLS
jgi:hypothetical protein